MSFVDRKYPDIVRDVLTNLTQGVAGEVHRVTYDPNARPIQPTEGRQLNEVTFNVDFENQSIGGLNFVFSRAGTGIASRTRRT